MLLGSYICLSYEFLAFTQNAMLWKRPMMTLLENDRTITDEFAILVWHLAQETRELKGYVYCTR